MSGRKRKTFLKHGRNVMFLLACISVENFKAEHMYHFQFFEICH